MLRGILLISVIYYQMVGVYCYDIGSNCWGGSDINDKAYYNMEPNLSGR